MAEVRLYDLAYLAGIVDGEGCVTMRQQPSGNLVIRLQVVSTTEVLIDWLMVRYGGKRYTIARPNRPEHKTAYHWHLASALAVDLLREILPYLVIKRSQADLAIYAWENRRATPMIDRRKPLPPGLLELRKEWVDQMHALNKKGA